MGKVCGSEYDLNVVSPAEAIRALIYQIPEFRSEMEKGEYRVRKIYLDGTEVGLDEESIHLSFGRAVGFVIEPVIRGSKKRGIGKIILGIALISAAVYFSAGVGLGAAIGGNAIGITYGQVATLGVTMFLQGVSQLLAPTPDDPEEAKEKKSFSISARGNIAQQGAAVPLIYGECYTGSVMISAGISVEELEDGASGGGAVATPGGPSVGTDPNGWGTFPIRGSV